MLNRAGIVTQGLRFAFHKSEFTKGYFPTFDFAEILDDACVQMLILKLLYLIFTTEELFEFFYTNDLCVLVDIVLRELCDLGDENDAEAVSDILSCIFAPV
jgi:hypothetical protein